MDNKYQLNNTYLVKYGSSASISSVTILLITDKTYYVQWNCGMNSNTTWELKKRFDMDYNMIENITDYMTHESLAMNPSSRNVIVKRISCPSCYGSGVIPDTSSTAGDKLCPQCFGSKTVPDFITIL